MGNEVGARCLDWKTQIRKAEVKTWSTEWASSLETQVNKFMVFKTTRNCDMACSLSIYRVSILSRLHLANWPPAVMPSRHVRLQCSQDTLSV